MSEQREPIEPAPRAPDANAPRVRTLLLCDLADSTALVERLGDAAAAELIRRHDRIARDLLQRFRGREIDKSDGFLALFERPVEAVGFALHYQRALRSLVDDPKRPLRARVGIHVGEVVLWENTRAEIESGAKQVEVEGLAKPVVARLMALALPGQILLSGVAFSIAQRAEKELDNAASLRWLTHGRYHFKGVPAPMLVHEVGEAGFAPLHAPPSGPKAARDVPLWRRPSVLALEAIALIAAIAVPLALSLRAPPAIAFGERDWVVMGELRNLTGETLLDDSLETAFRISLEQSRHVNVLPDLKLRDALARMQRPPDTAIDRGVASEIALREGARAVILPTVAEVGGRVRVSAEVVDPSTQTTVYAESADGVGAVSTLDSIDRVTHELRAKLGEALASIEQDSAPLPKVTSGNLDALRAYALGYDAYLRAEFKSAQGLYQQALTLDPEFSQAKVGLARIHMATENPAAARLQLAQALAHRDRLPPRELLYAEAFEAMLEGRADYLDRWEGLISTYPDFFPSYYNYALYAWLNENRYDQPIEVATRGLSQKNPAFGVLHYLIGTLELGREAYGPAQEHLQQAKALGADASGWVWAMLHGARRDIPAADLAVQSFKTSGVASNDLFGHVVAAAVQADRGDLPAAGAALESAAALALSAGPPYERLLGLIQIELDELAGADVRGDLLPRLSALVDAESVAAAEGASAGASHAAFILGWSAATAWRWDEPVLARSARDRAASLLEGRYHPVAAQMLAVADAQQALLQRRPEDGLKLLASLEDDSALLAVRVLRMDLLAAAGRTEEAIQVAEQVAAARGRAYTEYGTLYSRSLRNVIDTNLAHLRIAELAAERGDAEASTRALAEFSRIWPDDRWPPAIRDRVRRMR